MATLPHAVELVDGAENDPKRARTSRRGSDCSLLSAQLDELRRNRILTDFHLISAPNGERFPLHACVAAARSPSLRAAIDSGNKEVVLNLDSDVLRRLVDIMYHPESFILGDDEQVTKGAQLLNITCISEPDSPQGTPLLALSGSPTTANMHCKQVITGHSGYVYALLITESGLIVSGSRDHSLRVWEPNGALVKELRVHLNRVWCLLSIKTSQGRDLILSGSWDKTIKIIDAKTWSVVNTLTGHDDWVTCLEQVSHYVVSGSADSTLRVWDMDHGFRQERVLRGHAGHIYALCGLRNGDHIISGGQDSVLRVWETHHWREHKVLAGHQGTVRALCEWDDGMILSGASDGKIIVWSWQIGFVKVNAVQAHQDWVEALVVLDSRRFASGSRDDSVCIWNRELVCLQKLVGHQHWVYALASDGKTLVSGSCDLTIRVWNESPLSFPIERL